MITFKQYLAEESPTLDDFLKKHCGHYLERVTNENLVLFRGIAKDYLESGVKVDLQDHRSAMIISVRKDRVPRDTNPIISNFIDEELEKKFGWRPRSQGLFCYGGDKNKRAPAEAFDYGKPYIVYPIGNFSFLYNSKVDDLTVQIGPGSELRREHGINFQVLKPSDPELDKALSIIKREILAGYQDTDLIGGMKSDAEIMIECDKFLAVYTLD